MSVELMNALLMKPKDSKNAIDYNSIDNLEGYRTRRYKEVCKLNLNITEFIAYEARRLKHNLYRIN